MNMHSQDLLRLQQEQGAMVSHLARVQSRCSALIQQQAAEIAVLRAEAMRMRAALIARDTALAWAYEDRAALEAAIPDLPQRMTLARRVQELSKRLQDLMREKLRPTVSLPARPEAPVETGDMAALEASIVAADLVICQTGCLSHGAYWRVQDHCKRTGKTCMLVAQPASVRIVRIHQDKAADAASKTAMNPV